MRGTLVKMKIKSAGFTLVELLIVVSVVLISVGVAGDLIVSVIRSYNKTRIFNEIEQNANFVTSKINYELKNARSVSVAGNVITYVKPEGVSATLTTYELRVIASGTCSANANCLIRRRTSPAPTIDEVMTNEDTSDGVHVSLFTPTLSADGRSLSIQMTLQQTLGTVSVSQRATNTYNWVVYLSGIP